MAKVKKPRGIRAWKGRHRKYKPARRGRTMVGFGGYPIAPQALTTHKFIINRLLTLPTAQPGNKPYSHVFHTNALKDPDSTVGGEHTPLAYDQMKTFYDRCAIVSSSVKITFINDNTISTHPNKEVYSIALGLRPQDTVETVDINLFRERGDTVHSTIVGDQTKSLRMKWDAKKFYGVKDIMGDSGLTYQPNKASPDNIPTKKPEFHVVVAGVDNTTTTAERKVWFMVELTFKAQWAERRPLAQSVP